MRAYPRDPLLENVWNAARRFLLLWRGVAGTQLDLATWAGIKQTRGTPLRPWAPLADGCVVSLPPTPTPPHPHPHPRGRLTDGGAPLLSLSQMSCTCRHCTDQKHRSSYLAGLSPFSSESKRIETISRNWHYLASRKLFPFSLLLSDLACQIRLILAAIKGNNNRKAQPGRRRLKLWGKRNRMIDKCSIWTGLWSLLSLVSGFFFLKGLISYFWEQIWLELKQREAGNVLWLRSHVIERHVVELIGHVR